MLMEISRENGSMSYIKHSIFSDIFRQKYNGLLPTS